MSQALRTLTATANKTGTTILFLSQLEPIVPDVLHPFDTGPHGNALKYYASQRLDVRSLEVVAHEDAPRVRVQVKVTKNKIAPPFRSVDLFIEAGVGVVEGLTE